MATKPNIFGFIRSKTTANFCKGTRKLRENITCVVDGKIIHYYNVINVNS